VKDTKDNTAIDEIRDLLDARTEVPIFAPWCGEPIPVTVVMLSTVSLNSCGDFSTVELPAEGSAKAPELAAMLKIKNIHENILRLCLVRPTFDELHDYVLEKDFIALRKHELSEIRAMLPHVEDNTERAELEDRIERLTIMLSFLLPEDFMAYVVAFQLQTDKTDMKKLNKDMLIQAGFLGEKYGKRPAEYIDGVFTNKQKIDIDVAALGLLQEYREMQKMEKGSTKTKWIRGKNHRGVKHG